MSHRIEIVPKNANDFFYFQTITSVTVCGTFDCRIPEHNDYLINDVLNQSLAKTRAVGIAKIIADVMR